MRARLVSLGGDGDEANIEVQIVKGQSPRLQQHEQQIELLEKELDQMDERFEKQEERLNLLQVKNCLYNLHPSDLLRAYYIPHRQHTRPVDAGGGRRAQGRAR